MEHSTFGPYPDPTPGPAADVVQSGRSRRLAGRRGAAVAAGALALVAGGGAAAWAASSAPAPSPGGTATVPAPGEGAQPGGGGRPGRGGPGGLLGALHGELTVPDGNGGAKRVLVQRGAVTAVSPTLLTVKSADGYTHTYVLDGATVVNGTRGDVSTLKAGDAVGVLADGSSTATRVTEPGTRGKGPGERQGGGSWHRHGPGPGRTAPGSPAPGSPAPGGPAPGSPAPGAPAPGSGGAAPSGYGTA